MLKNRLVWLMIGTLALVFPMWSSMPSAAQENELDPVEFRFAHLSPDAPAVDFYVDGVLLAENVAFGTVTDWIIIAEDTYDIAVTVSGDSIEDAVFVAENVDFSANANIRITVIAYGSVERGTLAATLIRENFNPTNSARLEVFHALERGPALDLLSDDLLLLGGLAYPNTRNNNDGHFTLELPPREYPNLRLEADGTDVTLLSVGDVTLEAGKSYFIAAVGPYLDPSLVIVTSEIGTPEPIATPTPEPTATEVTPEATVAPAETTEITTPEITATLIPTEDAEATPEATLTIDEAANETPIGEVGADITTPEATPFVSSVEFVNVRIGHFVPDAPAVDLYLNGIRVGESISFGTVTDWLLVPGNIVDVAVVPSGEAIGNAVLSLEDFSLPIVEETQRATIAVIGSVENDTLDFQSFIENFTPLAAGETRLEIFHAIENGPVVDVFVNDALLVADLAYPRTFGDNDGQFGVNAPAGLANLQITNSNTGELLAAIDGLVFNEKISYLIVVAASPTGEVLVFTFETPIPE